MNESLPIAAHTESVPAIAVSACWNISGVWGNRRCPQLEQSIHCRNCAVFSGAAAQLLDRPASAEDASAWSSLVAQRKLDERRSVISIIIFRVGDEWLALPTGSFEEVAALRVIHSLPNRSGGIVLGLANVRGALLVCVSLARLFNIGSSEPSRKQGPAAGSRLLVLGSGSQRIACPVDEVQGVHRHAADELAEVPATLTSIARHCSRAVLAWREHSVGLLDSTSLFEAINRSLASTSAT